MVEELRAVGAEPFVVPAMGSHGGATVEGQRAVLAEYGITEAEVGAPILATMDTVEVGTLDDGTPCYMDRHAWEADAVVVVGRVKAHTAFRAEIESGLCKMLAIGLGKQRGAETNHARGLAETIPAVASVILGDRQGRAGPRPGRERLPQAPHHPGRRPGRLPRRRPRAAAPRQQPAAARARSTSSTC